LLLEKEAGMTEYLFEKRLKDYASKAKKMPEIVFVSSCKS